jgi:hypothetical protein
MVSKKQMRIKEGESDGKEREREKERQHCHPIVNIFHDLLSDIISHYWNLFF